MSDTILIGGKRSGQRVKVGPPEYRFHASQKCGDVLATAYAHGAFVQIYQLRYIRTEIHWDRRIHVVYVWEHSIHLDLIELMTTEIERFAATQPAAQRQWVGLTDEEMYFAIRPLYKTDALANAAVALSKDEYRAIEAKLKAKNSP